MGRRPLIGVMGAGEGADAASLRLAGELGEAIARRGWGLLSGGRPCGVMAAACQAALAVPGHLVVGVLPDDGRGDSRQATAPLDVALFTGLGQARNVIHVLSSDVVVVCGAGGAGTLSEAAHALKAGRPLLLLATPPAWQDLFGGLGGTLRTCDSAYETIDAIERLLAAAEASQPAAGAASSQARADFGGADASARAMPAAISPASSSATAFSIATACSIATASSFATASPSAAASSVVTAPSIATVSANATAPEKATASANAKSSADATASAVATSSVSAEPRLAAAATAQPGSLPVALVQLQAGEDGAANRRHAEAWLERALQPPAGTPRPRLLMLPEIWNAPYQAARFAEYAEPVPEPGASLLDGPCPSLAMVAALAKRHGISVIAGSIPERGRDGRLYNTATVIDAEGHLRAKHRKLHLFDVDVPGGIRFRESDSLTGGERLTVLDGMGDPLGTGLRQPPGLGLLICYDIRFPELSLLMQQQLGCSVIACPAAFNTTTGPRHWHLVLRARALDTQCFLLACSSARPSGGESYPSYGHSLVVDPWGAVLAEAGTGEQVLHAQLALAQVALARQAIPTSRQRRHDLYRLTALDQADQ